MAFLLDTTVLSELTKAAPNGGVLDWLSAQLPETLFICAPALAETIHGVAALEPSAKKRSLDRWLQGLIDDFGDRMLPFDVRAAVAWGRATAASRKTGRTLPAIDAQIAAVALVYGLTVVTRNVRHFQTPGFEELRVINPWK